MEESVSVIIPVHNEEGTLTEIVDRLSRTLSNQNNINPEIIIADDGSTDNTYDLALKIREMSKIVRVEHHSVRKGKTEAILTAYRKSIGGVIVIIDGDLQYAPEDLPKLLQPILIGEKDLVNGRKLRRHDPVSRRISSRVYNWMIRKLFDVEVFDNNSGFKCIRREAIEAILPQLRSDFHRFLIPLAKYNGFRIMEVAVQSLPRKLGKSKYANPMRLLTGMLDLITLKATLTFSNRPTLFFMIPGSIMELLGIVSGIDLIILKFLYGESLSNHLPLLSLTLLLIISGILLFALGFLARMIAILNAEVRELFKSHRSG